MLGLFRSTDAFLQRQPFWMKVVLSLVLAALIGWLDYLTGYELVFSLFYLVPILFAAWYLGGWSGIAISLLSSILTPLTDSVGGQAYPGFYALVWNTEISFGLYSILVFLARSLHVALQKESQLARTDALTGAANSRLFLEALETEIERSRRYNRPFVLAYLDVDNFKAVNDTQGHKAGDRLLKDIARLVRSHVRSPDLLARIGGDEFTLLMPETDATSGEAALSKILQALQTEFSALDPPIAFSAGLLACKDPAEEADALLSAVDALMYEAKRAGGGSIRARSITRER